MSDFFNRIIGLFLVFILLVIAPLIIQSLSRDLTIKRSILNEMTNFVDKVTDTGHISELDKTDFYVGCSSYGAVVDIKIKRYMRIVNPDGNGSTYCTYVLTDKITDWDQGDIIEVDVQAIDHTTAQKLAVYFNKVSTPKLDFQLAGMIR
ncbi:hypothetical protein [Vallitalea guaymasensis]|uniref:hypothetical protein n=1 Tax=Vallitalea guaymasensis TaxID=1185412 RepID=UPI000DE28B7F|nr:hypothetical protein [Vallitalea guaymasensis]